MRIPRQVEISPTHYSATHLRSGRFPFLLSERSSSGRDHVSTSSKGFFVICTFKSRENTCDIDVFKSTSIVFLHSLLKRKIS